MARSDDDEQTRDLIADLISMAEEDAYGAPYRGEAKAIALGVTELINARTGHPNGCPMCGHVSKHDMTCPVPTGKGLCGCAHATP